MKMAAAVIACLMVGAAPANPAAVSPPAELRSVLPDARQAGRARLSVWGFQIYDASLWVKSGFKAAAFHEHDFALELTYLRAFSRDEIARRSLTEMSRQREISADKAALWEGQLRNAIADVKPGDRITGLHRPGEGASFLINGKTIDTIRDAEFSRLFFAIWLAESTSEPAMRRDLLSLGKP